MRINWDRLREVEHSLRRYVHGSCSNLYECPEDHGHILSLDQSFAWTIAERLHGIIERGEDTEVQTFLRETLMYYATLKRRQQSSRYPELIHLIKEVYRSCRDKEEGHG